MKRRSLRKQLETFNSPQPTKRAKILKPLTLTVEAPSDDNGGLEANDDAVDLSLSEDEQAIIDVIENDDYPDDNFPNIVVTEQPDNGMAGQNAELISYTPEADFTGTDTFQYTLTIRDRAAGTAFSDTAMVTVNVQQ